AAAAEAARDAALRVWRNRNAPDVPRARAALAAFGAALDTTDWFAPGAPPPEVANDAAFFLQQTGGCGEAAEAVLLLDVVLRAAPSRVPARLNRADALTRRAACATDGVARAEAAEEYRLYCTAQGPGSVPRAIARRIATALEVPRLNAAACRPRLGAHRAVVAGDAAALAGLLAQAPEDAMAADARGQYPLGHAVARRDVVAARLLLEAGADPDRAGQSAYAYPPLVSAAWNGDVAMLGLLVAHRARVDPVNPPVLPLLAAAQAARSQDAGTVRAMLTLLLDAGAAVDATNAEGATALMEAAGAAAPPELIALLVGRGAAVNRVNRYGRNAAFAVAPFVPAADATMAALIAAGVNLDQQDQRGTTPLNQLFAWSGRSGAVVRLLAARMLAAGADPRLPDMERRSALFRAATSGDVALTELMLAAPARGPYPASDDPVPLLRRRLADATRQGCPCVAEWRAILGLLGAE
ncbi:ankyrin repeat domain-containing protein, partial [Plastoroseomonas arctica]